MSDFEKFAVYNRNSERWVAVPMPWQVGRNGGMIIAPLDEGAVVLALRCTSACPREETPEDAAELVVLATDRPGRLREVPIAGLESRSVPVSTLLARPEQGGAQAAFVAYSPGFVTVVRADLSGATAERMEGDFQQVCTMGGRGVGISAIERVDDDDSDAVPFVPPPSNAPPDAPRPKALRIIAGTDLRSLQPVDIPAGPRQVLGDQLTLTTACTPQGLTIFGASDAWTYNGSEWVPSSTSIDDRPLRATAVSTEQLPDGTLLIMTTAGSFERNPSGEWRPRSADAGQTVAMGADVITYRPQQASNNGELDTELEEPPK